MQNSKNKTITTLRVPKKKILISITLLLIASMISISPLSVNLSEAQVVQQRPMFLFVGAAPDPVGVGQPVTIVTWTSEMCMPSDNDASLGAPGGRETWTGITITITNPDQTSKTISLPPSDPVGGNYYSFVPDQPGNYSVIANFPGEWKNRTAPILYGPSSWQPFGAGSYYFQPAKSDADTFTVVEEPLSWISGVPLPTEYWSRPIYAYDREWSQIAGNWITGLRDLPYITAPNTAHIMWTEPYFYGGIAGGAHEAKSYYEGTSYEGKFGGVTIMQGVLLYNLNLGSSASYTKLVARDLRTGEMLWEQNGTSISMSTIFEYDSRNQHGVHPYLWVSGNRVLDPFSGIELFRFTNVPSGTAAVGPKGERLIYVLGGPTSGTTETERPTTNATWLALWNFSAPLSMTGITTSQLAYYNKTGELVGTEYDQWRPVGKTINGNDGYSWNITVPTGLRATTANIAALSDRIIAGSGWQQFGTAAPHGNFRLWALSLDSTRRGQLLWDISIKPPVANATLQFGGSSYCSIEDGIFLVRVKETRQWMGFDINSGKQLWITDPQPQWMMYSSDAAFYNGTFYSGGYGGQVFAYDAKTGELLWTATVDAEGLESAYERSPLSVQVVDGKVFAQSQEHSMTNPYYRTWKVYAFDAKTGDRIWDLNGGWSSAGFADGYRVALNYFDNQIYSIGKGPSATNVEVQNDVINHGNGVTIKGMVTDISPGTNDYSIAARFPNGVPAIADESMTAWMEYVYMQKPKPADITGVEVVINVLDPNNNTYEVGRTTSDADGMFKLSFTPQVPGEYTVIASFAGSESYWPSHAKTAIAVTEAAPQPTQQTVLAQSSIEMYLISGVIAIIIAIAIVGSVIVLMLKKRQ